MSPKTSISLDVYLIEQHDAPFKISLTQVPNQVERRSFKYGLGGILNTMEWECASVSAS